VRTAAKGLSDTEAEEEEEEDEVSCEDDEQQRPATPPESRGAPAAAARGPASTSGGGGGCSSVVEWLEGLGLDEYAEALLAEGYDEVALLASLGTAEVEEMLIAAEVVKAGHRLKIRHALRALHQEQ